LSPDDRWIAYIAVQQGKPTLFVDSFPQPGNKHEIAVDDPNGLDWVTEGELIVVNSRSEVFSVPVKTSPTFEAGTARRIFRAPPGVAVLGTANGGQRFLTGKIDARPETSRLEVVVDWPKLIARK
jgi:hypothetical protein